LVDATFPETPARRPNDVTPFLVGQDVIFDELNDFDAENELEFPLETVPFIR
jgi:hypothetical protein